jgi:hypothetical protein
MSPVILQNTSKSNYAAEYCLSVSNVYRLKWGITG